MKTQPLYLTLAILILASSGCIDFARHQKIDWAEGHITRSPDKKWVVLMKSTSTSSPDESFIKLLVFDAELNPELKGDSVTQSQAQRRPPQASYVIPVQMYTRMTNFRWDDEKHVVEITQGQVNALQPLTYRLDLKTFSLTKVEK